MKKQLFTIAIIIGIVAQVSVLAWMLISREMTLRHGAICLLQTAPFDPADPFRGRYVTLRYQQLSSTSVNGNLEEWRRGSPVWLTFKTNESGIATLDTALRQKPDSPLAVKTHISYSYYERAPADPPVTNQYGYIENHPTGKIRLNFNNLPFERYYLPEKLAPAAENAYRRALLAAAPSDNTNQPNQKVYAKIRLRNGQAVIEDLLFDTTPLRKFLQL